MSLNKNEKEVFQVGGVEGSEGPGNQPSDKLRKNLSDESVCVKAKKS